MSVDDLPDELRALFDAERRRDDAPGEAAKQRVRQAVAASIAVGLSSAAAGGAAAAGPGALASAEAASVSAAMATTAGVTATGGALAKGLALALVTAMVGTTGAGVWLATRERKPPPAITASAPAAVRPARFDAEKVDPHALPFATGPGAHRLVTARACWIRPRRRC